MKRVILRLMNVFVALFMVGMLVTVSTPQPVMAETGVVVDLVLLPASQTVVNGDTFTIAVEARCSEQEIGSIAANLDYDHDYLEVQSITDGLRFPNVVSDFAVAGEINFTGMTTSFFPHDTFTVYTVTFLATDLTASTTISFHTAMDMRKTDAMKAGSKLRSTTDATVTITPGTLVSIEVTPDPASMVLGETLQFSANGTYTGGTANITATVTWDSSDTDVATINSAGLATSVAAGTTDITASLDGITSDPVVTLTVTTGAVDHIELSPETATITADETQGYSVEALNSLGGSWNGTAATIFTINATAGGSWTANVYTPETVSPPGTPWTVTANCSGKIDTANLTVTVGALEHIVISPDTATITADEVQVYTAEAFDQHDNTRGDITSGTTFTINATAGGSWTDNVYTAEIVSPEGTPWTVTGNYTGKTDTAILTVTVGALDHIEISTDTPTITTDDTATFTSAAYDADSNSWDVTASTNFTIEAGALGSWADNVYTPQKVGTWTVTGNYTDKIDTATLVVEGGPVVYIVLSPADTSITADDTQAYTVEAYDGVGEHWAVTASANTSYSINATALGSWADNVYTAEIVSPPGTYWTVTATYGGTTDTGSSVTGTANLTVTVGALHHIVISPDTATITADETQAYTAEAFDQHDNTLGDVTANSTAFVIVESGHGGSWAANVYTAVKTGTWTVEGSHNGKADTATLTVTRGALDQIVISTVTPTITADDTATFTSAAYDADLNSWWVTTETTFAIEASANGTWTANVYTAEVVSPTTNGGPWTVTGNHTATGKLDTTTLTVTVGALASIVVTPASGNITAGHTTFDDWGYDFTAAGFDQHGNTRGDITGGTTTWTSSDTGIASIESRGRANPGRATGIRAGQVTITATRSGVSGTATPLTVTAAEIVSIAVTADVSTITVNATQEFRAMGTYSDGSVPDVTDIASWTSDNETVATINAAGVATGHAAGTAIITASLSGKSDTFNLTVIDVPLVSINVTATALVVNAGETQQFLATGNFSSGPGDPGTLVNLTNLVTWESSDTTVAIINAAGLATSYAQGTTNITASKDGISSANVTLTVNAAILESVTVTPAGPTITFVSGNPPAPINRLQFTATAIYSDGEATDNTSESAWSVAPPGIATIVAGTGLATIVAAPAPANTTTVSALVDGKTGNTLLTVLADTVAPVVTLTSPSGGLIISSASLNITGSIDDTTAVTRANTDVIVNGNVTALTVDANGDFNQLIGAGDGLTAGSNTILVRAVDDDGNKGVSGTRTVEINPNKPDITITSPAEGLLTKTDTVTVEITIVGATSATLRLNGRVVTTTANGTVTVANVPLLEGTNTIVVSGWATGFESNDDYLGTSGVRTVTLDTTAPVVAIISPASGSVVSTRKVTVTGTVDDPGVSTVNLLVSTASENTTWPSVPVVGGSINQTVTLLGASGTENTISVVATDSVNNASSVVSATVTFDNTKPQVTITTPVNNLLTNVAGLLVTGNVSDPSIETATLYLNGASQPVDVAPDGSFSKMVALTATQNTIEVRATDTAENTGTSGVVNVELDTTPPAVNIGLTDPTDSIIITVDSNEALRAAPIVSVNLTAITMTQTGVNQWTGVFPIPADNQYTVTANATDRAGNLSTATATFLKETVTIDKDVPETIVSGNTTLVVDTNEDVANQPISVTQHLENPAENAESETEAGIFLEIVASGNLTDSIQSIDIQVNYDEVDIAARGIAESTLRLYLWNATTGQWEIVPGSNVNTVANYIYGTVTHLSKYGVFVTAAPAEEEAPPIYGEPTPKKKVEEEAPPAPEEPGVTDVSDVVTEEGVFTEDVTAESEDAKVELTIDKDTTGKTVEGEPLSTISITEVAVPPAPPVDTSIVGLTYELGPDDATFDPPITLTFTYDPFEVPEGANEEELVIATWDEDAGQWVELEGCIVDTVHNTISAPVSHLSKYAIIARVVPPPPPEEEVPPAPEPAAFSVSDLTVQPAKVEPNKTVTISVSVANTGGTEGSYTVVLKINGVKEADKSVTVAAGSSKVVTFSVTKADIGSYSVAVDDLSASFTVVAPPPPPPPEEEVIPPAPVAWWVWLIVGLAAAAVIGVVIWLVLRRRRA